MKIIKYRVLSGEVNHTAEEQPETRQVFLEKSMSWSEANLEIAAQEAWGGEYTIEDDGQPEPVKEPTAEERIAELEEALELLLTGVTE